MNKKISKYILLCLCYTLLFTNTRCDDDEDVKRACGQAVVIDKGYYEAATSDAFDFIHAEVIDNCLSVNLSASGCNGETWSIVIVDSGIVSASAPDQRNLKLVFSNEEMCKSVFTQNRMFDLSRLQIENSNEVILNIEGIPGPIHYIYE